MGEWEKSKPVESASIICNIIKLWLHRRKGIGDDRAKEGYQQAYRAKVTDLENFREFARKHSSQTQEEMAQAWQREISHKTIDKALKKIWFTRKKLTSIDKDMNTKDKNFL